MQYRFRFLLTFFYYIKVIFVILPIFVYSCALTDEVELSKKELKLRCVNINIIFDYIVNKDTEVKLIKERKKNLIESIDRIERELQDSKDEKDNVIKIEKREKYRNEIKNIKSREDYYKEKILNQIDRAVQNVAKRRDIDFIFNISDNTIFTKKEYDITEDVIREIVRLQKRNAPVSR